MLLFVPRTIFGRSADILVCRCAGFPTCGTRRSFQRLSCYRRFADWKVGATADKNVCATSEDRSLLLAQKVTFSDLGVNHAGLGKPQCGLDSCAGQFRVARKQGIPRFALRKLVKFGLALAC